MMLVYFSYTYILNILSTMLVFVQQANDLPAIIGVCTSKSSLTWLSFLFAYKGFILLAGLFLAFETRKVKNAPLNDSRFVAMSIYEVVIVSIALTPIGMLLEHYPIVQYGIIGIMILLSTTVILGLIFVTKVCGLICNHRYINDQIY